MIAGGSHCSAAQRLRALGWFADAGWQDLRAVHDSRCPCSEKGPFLARYSRGVSSNGDLRGFSDTWRAHLAKASSFWMHGAQILPRSPPFLVRGPFLDTWSAKLATDCRPGTHRARISSLPVRPRAHQGAVLPPSDTGKRISRAFCHRRAPGNAPRHNLATIGRPRRTPRAPMSHGSHSAHAPWLRTPPRLPTPPGIPTPLNCGCCRRFGRWRWHNPLTVALLPSGS